MKMKESLYEQFVIHPMVNEDDPLRKAGGNISYKRKTFVVSASNLMSFIEVGLRSLGNLPENEEVIRIEFKSSSDPYKIELTVSKENEQMELPF